MTPPTIGKLRELLSQQKWDSAIELLQGLSASDAADLIMAMRFEEQQALFRRLPISLAASIVNHLPYFHAYVLLHARPLHEMAAIVEAMSQAERDHFLDALPEEAWNSLMDELAEAGSTAAPHSEQISEVGHGEGSRCKGLQPTTNRLLRPAEFQKVLRKRMEAKFK